MLKVEINGKEGIVKIEAKGILPELMADVTSLLQTMYEGINENEKEKFKECIKSLAEKEIYTKSEEEIANLVKAKREDFKKKLEKELGDLIKGLFN